MLTLAKSWLGLSNKTNPLTALESSLALVTHAEAALKPLSAEALRQRFQDLRTNVSRGESIETCLVPAFTLAREAAYRSIGKRPYDVQMLAGLALAQGMVAEMATGEGKTLTIAAPALWLALAGRGVHVATVNAYLAKRDCELMRPIYQSLGLTVGLLPEANDPKGKLAAYRCDVTYGTGYEYGFDYLRDQLRLLNRPAEKLGANTRRLFLQQAEAATGEVQRGLPYAIVDEIDSVLIDEALTPLIVSQSGGKPHASPQIFHEAHRQALRLLVNEDYEVEQSSRSVHLTKAGLRKIYADELGPAPASLQRAWHEYLLQALRAQHNQERDVQYLVRKGQIEIIDEFTGRSFKDRKWREGLHQAVEAKEGVPISEETSAEVSLSRQVFYQMYDRVGGLTGTARESAEELQKVYHLSVVPIPLHRPSQRVILPDRIFVDWSQKNTALVAEIARRHATGQPILVGTRTVQRSEELAVLLQASGLRVAVLNAHQDAQEAELIAQAGQCRAITIATNMAGRGADIHLGPGAHEIGGLHVIGQERNESCRIDRQLVGRSARQGEPGSAQFFLCLEDDLWQRHAPVVAASLLKPTNGAGELPPEIAPCFIEAQRRLEKKQQGIREQLMQQDTALKKIKRHL